MGKDKVTVIGSINYDLIIQQSRLPLKGETFTGDGMVSAPGGKGANQAVQAARLGLKTYMVGKTGDDTFADACFKSLEDANVNCDHVQKLQSINTGLGIVHLLPDGDYYSTILTGANFAIGCDDIQKVEPLLAESKIVILQMEIPTKAVENSIELAHQNGCYVILNLAPPKSIRPEILKLVDCLIVNETEASFLTGTRIDSQESSERAADSLLQRVGDLLIITLGIKGSIAFRVGQKAFEPTNGIKALDATGAGDSFIGGVAYCLYHGIRDVSRILKIATFVSSVSITRYGGQPSFPRLGELDGIEKILHESLPSDAVFDS